MRKALKSRAEFFFMDAPHEEASPPALGSEGQAEEAAEEGGSNGGGGGRTW